MPKSKSSTSKEKPVELGFAEEEPEGWKLSSAFFASKFGGKPAWLDLKNLPKSSELKCSSCEGPTKFLLQVYAPLDADEAFHRVIYLFVCSKQHCCAERNSSKNVVVMRCQLPRTNDFYSTEPPKYDSKLAEVGPEMFGVKTCILCGVLGPQFCGSCKKVNYCCKDHQTADWKSGHKEECTDADFTGKRIVDKFNFKEYEIVIDTEVIPKEIAKEKSDKSKIEEFQKLVSEGKAGTMDDTSLTKDMLEAASYKSDKAFNKFRKRVAYQPDQILRYDRSSEPLCVASDKMPIEEVPPCQYCKGPRVFEFQVMPQLLNYLGQDSLEGYLDWGTIAVYTCEKSCGEGMKYKAEFAWQQDFKADDKDNAS